MPWYYFSLENGDGGAAASEVEQFPDDQAALEHAKSIARDFARNETAPGSLRIVARKEDGAEIGEVPLARSSN